MRASWLGFPPELFTVFFSQDSNVCPNLLLHKLPWSSWIWSTRWNSIHTYTNYIWQCCGRHDTALCIYIPWIIQMANDWWSKAMWNRMSWRRTRSVPGFCKRMKNTYFYGIYPLVNQNIYWKLPFIVVFSHWTWWFLWFCPSGKSALAGSAGLSYFVAFSIWLGWWMQVKHGNLGVSWAIECVRNSQFAWLSSLVAAWILLTARSLQKWFKSGKALRLWGENWEVGRSQFPASLSSCSVASDLKSQQDHQSLRWVWINTY